MRTGFVILFSSVLFLNQEHRRQAPWATNQPESRDSRELPDAFLLQKCTAAVDYGLCSLHRRGQGGVHCDLTLTAGAGFERLLQRDAGLVSPRRPAKPSSRPGPSASASWFSTPTACSPSTVGCRVLLPASFQ